MGEVAFHSVHMAYIQCQVILLCRTRWVVNCKCWLRYSNSENRRFQGAFNPLARVTTTVIWTLFKDPDWSSHSRFTNCYSLINQHRPLGHATSVTQPTDSRTSSKLRVKSLAKQKLGYEQCYRQWYCIMFKAQLWFLIYLTFFVCNFENRENHMRKKSFIHNLCLKTSTWVPPQNIVKFTLSGYPTSIRVYWHGQSFKACLCATCVFCHLEQKWHY